MPDCFAVVGNPVAHSLSPIIHQYFAKQMGMQFFYKKMRVEEEFFERKVLDFFKQEGKGLNITVPFKQRAFAMADQHSTRCKQAGAANTLWMKETRLHADNTDGVGFIRDLNRYVAIPGKRVLVLGAGGAARGIIHPLLANHPAELVLANRTLAKRLELQQAFPQVSCVDFQEVEGQFDVVVHATSVSLSGELITLPSECLLTKPLCYDLSYTQHGETAFVHYARDSGCFAVDGLGMLIEQAAESFFIWHGLRPDTGGLLEKSRDFFSLIHGVLKS